MGSGVIVATAAAGDEGLTAAIRREHEAASAAAQTAIEHALECGRLLAEARLGISHGSWESFVRGRCGIAPRTARLYMQLDARRDRIANRQHVAGLRLREAARLVAEPKTKAVPEAAVEAEPELPFGGGDVAGEADGWGLRLAVPDWYRPGHRHFGLHQLVDFVPSRESHVRELLRIDGDHIVRKQLGRLVADAESLLGAVAWRDLPAGLRIIDIVGGRLAGFCIGSGHRFAQAHGCHRGAVAVAVAAEHALRASLDAWADNLPAALGEAALAIEFVAAHEAAHAVTNDIDGELQPVAADILRKLPALAGTAAVNDSAEQTARDHGAPWAAGVVILSQRCSRYRPEARHRWPEILRLDLEAKAIDPQVVAEAVGDVGDEQPLRELLAPGGDIVARVAAAIPNEAQRAAIIAARRSETPLAEPGRVAPVAAGAA